MPNTTKYCLMFIALFTLLLSGVKCLASTEPNEKRYEIMKDDLSSRQSDVNEWVRDQKDEVILAVTVGVLGLIIGACQTGNHPSLRLVTVVLGLIVSIITLCTNAFYTADYQTLRRAIHSAHPMLVAMQHDIELYEPSMESQEFQGIQTDFYKI